MLCLVHPRTRLALLTVPLAISQDPKASSSSSALHSPVCLYIQDCPIDKTPGRCSQCIDMYYQKLVVALSMIITIISVHEPGNGIPGIPGLAIQSPYQGPRWVKVHCPENVYTKVCNDDDDGEDDSDKDAIIEIFPISSGENSKRSLH
ncbi:hypothetical protein DUI87_16519 [Hirundo rustica rustica]|uniref:Uncharacterized protein n=1 Tax=Hirundo rustica rustica TaxID=333673 RepID=A0A3M0K1H1_HIRRU|nr:hypothetical protein DUI87_16519 [Hirundo rustica rustica]